MTIKLGGVEPRDLLSALEERQANYALGAYYRGDAARQETHTEAFEAFEWVIDLMDADQTK